MNKLTSLRGAAALLLLCGAFSLSAQIITNDYTFEYGIDFYNEVTDGEVTPLAVDWFEIESDFSAVPPFDFSVYGKPVHGLTSYFTPSLLYFVPEDENDSELPFFVPFGSPDLQNRAMADGSTELSDISVKVTGEVGERIQIIQYRNAGFAGEIDSLGTADDFINFQLWLYEGSNAVEIHYGPYQVSNEAIDFQGATGPSFGLFVIEEANLDSGNPDVAVFIENDPMNPDVMTETENTESRALNGMPPTGMIYTLTPFADTVQTNTVQTLWAEGINVFPNPTAEVLEISAQDPALRGAGYVLTDTHGCALASGNVTETVQINLAGLPQGTYVLRVRKGNTGIVKRVVKL